MKLNRIFFFVLILFSLPFVVAETTVDVQITNDIITVFGTCTNDGSVGLQAGIGLNTVWFGQDDAVNGEYGTFFIAPQDGTYSVYVACQGDVAVSKEFCVGANCVASPPPSSSPSSSSSSSGGGSCTSKWSCSVWGYCDNTLQQSRTCVDLNKCTYSSKPQETQLCNECAESWICSEWSSCSYNKQLRTCNDEHQCGTAKLKPSLQKACTEPAPGYPPQQINPSYPPPPPYQPMVQQPASQQSLFKQLWDGYKEFIIAVPSALLLLIIIIIIVVHVTHKRKHMAYNHAELKAWIKKEMDMGTSKEETRQILAEHTGWSEDEISRTFSEFGDVNAPTSPGPSVDNLQ